MTISIKIHLQHDVCSTKTKIRDKPVMRGIFSLYPLEDKTQSAARQPVTTYAKHLMLTVALATFLSAVPAKSQSVAAEDLGITISVDGERIIGKELPADSSHNQDIALDKVDIQVKFDGLEVRPLLNVATTDLRRSYSAGKPVRFLATSNYPAWIERQEIRLFAKRDGISLGDIAKSGRPEIVLSVSIVFY